MYLYIEKIQGRVMMNKKKLTLLLSILVGTILTFAAVISTSAFTDSDPLVTLGYLEQVFKPAMKQEIVDEVSETVSAAVSYVQSQPAVEVSADVNEAASDDGQTDKASSSYTLIELSMGQTVLANSICEFIVRPGSKVAAVSPFPEQGIADITNGIEVLNGEMISINAYCLIPRGGDGRRMTVMSEKAYIMIRGDYTIG